MYCDKMVESQHGQEGGGEVSHLLMCVLEAVVEQKYLGLVHGDDVVIVAMREEDAVLNHCSSPHGC
jgi:hypothetical protein